MSEFSITVNVGEVTRVVQLIETAADDATELMKDVLLLMIRSTQRNFEEEGRPRWDDLKQSTIRRRFAKGARGPGAKSAGSLAILGQIRILRDSGLLLQSVGGGASGAFTSGAGFGDSDQFSAVIGTSQPGWQNQIADSRGWRVARPFLLFAPEDEEDIAAISIDWLTRSGPYSAD